MEPLSPWLAICEGTPPHARIVSIMLKNDVSRNKVLCFPITNANMSSRNIRNGRGHIRTDRSNSRLSLGRLTPGFSWYMTIRNKACSEETNTNNLLQTDMLYIFTIYFWSKVNIWDVNCARATVFNFDTPTDVLVKVSKFLWQKMSRPERTRTPNFGFMPNALTILAIRARRLLSHIF